jgi:hypothetical protein
MPRMSRGKVGSAQRASVQVRDVRRDGRTTPPPAATSQHSAARPVPEKEKIQETVIKLKGKRTTAAVPPVERINKLEIRGGRHVFVVVQMDINELNKKFKNKDMIYGMPFYFALLRAADEIKLWPVPGRDMTAEMEYVPL